MLDLPPMRFMAIAKVSWASLLMEPKDIAPVAKRCTISEADSTSSNGTAGPAGWKSNMPRSIRRFAVLLVHQVRKFPEALELSLPYGMLQFAHRVWVQEVALAAYPELVLAPDLQFGFPIP